jgi:hypothetical protein
MAFNNGYFSPQINGYGQAMPNVYQPYSQPTAEQSFFCRAVTNKEEVQAWPVDFTGRPMTFLGPNLQNVWIKTFNANTGGSDISEYRKVTPMIEEPPKVDFVASTEFQQLKETVESLKIDVSRLRTARRRSNREEDENDEV